MNWFTMDGHRADGRPKIPRVLHVGAPLVFGGLNLREHESAGSFARTTGIHE
jgi:hypothetical protein